MDVLYKCPSLPLTYVSDFGLGRILIGIPTSSQALLHRVHPGGQGVLGESWDQQLGWDRKWGTLLSSLSVSDGPELCALPPALPRPLLHSSLAAQWLHAPQHENCSLARRNHRGAGKNNPSGLGELRVQPRNGKVHGQEGYKKLAPLLLSEGIECTINFESCVALDY